jgi:hypothetical protein
MIYMPMGGKECDGRTASAQPSYRARPCPPNRSASRRHRPVGGRQPQIVGKHLARPCRRLVQENLSLLAVRTGGELERTNEVERTN